MIFENLKNAFRSILSAKTRSFLTMLGIIIGVYAVLTMISIGDGVKQEVTKQITDLGTNVLTVASGQTLNSGSTNSSSNKKSQSSFNLASSVGTSTLTTKDVQSVRNTANITSTAAVNIISSNVSAGSVTTSTPIVFAVEPSYSQIRNLKFESGTFYNDEAEKKSQNVVVLGAVTKQNLFGDQDAIGKTILVRNQPFTVSGVTAKQETGLNLGPSLDDAVYMPFSTGAQLIGSTQVYRILAQMDNPDLIDSTKQAITDVIRTNHGGQTDFSVLTQDDLISAFGSILSILTSFVIAIASISLLVGGIGIMNIMLVSVSERTREIGIRKAIGATSGNILWQFLIESIVIALLGGLIGLGLAFANRYPLIKYAKITPVFKPGAILLAFGVAFLIGIIFGVVPAIKAARKRPIQALKTV